MSTVVGYARVSTLEQAHQRSLEDQVFRLKAAGASRVYADVASRTKDDRSGLLELVELVRAGEVSAVLVTRLDRITSSPGLFERISGVFQRQKVPLVALDERVDIHSVEGEFVAGLQVHFARREVNTIRLRAQTAKEVGRVKGRASSSTPWGYCNIDGKYELDHTPFLCLLSDRPHDGLNFPGRTKAQLARDIVDIFFEVGSFAKATKTVHTKYGILKFQKPPTLKSEHYIFEEKFDYKESKNMRAGLFRWSKDGIRNYLSSPVLQGHTPYHTMITVGDRERRRAPQSQWDIRYNTHPEQALITEAEARRIQELIGFNREFKGWRNFAKGGNVHPLTGLVVCAHCGRTMRTKTSNYKGQTTTYYQCKNYAERACSTKAMIRMNVVEETVIAALTSKAQEIADLATTLEQPTEPLELKELRSQLATLEAIPGRNQVIEQAKAEVRLQLDAMVHKNQNASAQTSDNRELLLWSAKQPDFWQNLEPHQKQRFLRALVARVMVKDGKVQQVILKI
jgi:DNA invertase Pin-like site-specific DNA recombinase